MADAQKGLKERGIDGNRLRMAAICSVCSEPFTKHMVTFTTALVELGPVKTAG
jgi:coenzyme F420-reducing hydrogenase delta subunit